MHNTQDCLTQRAMSKLKIFQSNQLKLSNLSVLQTKVRPCLRHQLWLPHCTFQMCTQLCKRQEGLTMKSRFAS